MRASNPSEIVTLRASWQHAALLFAPAVLLAIAIHHLPWPLTARIAAIAFILGLLCFLALRDGLLLCGSSPATLTLYESHCELTRRDGQTLSRRLLPGTLILPWLVILQLHPGRIWLMPHSLSLSRLNCADDDFRRLRRLLVTASL